jgi:hypothetical protein
MTLDVRSCGNFSDPANIAALATLIAMEIVLGIDNLIFISILTNKLPEHQRSKARRVGISGARSEAGLPERGLRNSPNQSSRSSATASPGAI